MTENIDHQEVNKFAELADEWWNKNGDFKPLHVINPLRANYIKEKLDLESKSILDVGCGGGLLTEALYDSGANVTGIDAAGPGICLLYTSPSPRDWMVSRMPSSA